MPDDTQQHRENAAKAPLDFQEHLADLEAQGLLVRVDARRSTRTPSCIRSCAGSSSAASPRTSAARSSSRTSSTRRAGATTCRSPSARSPRRRGSTRWAWASRSKRSARPGCSAIAQPDPAGRSSSRRACQQVVITGDALREPGGGLARLPVPISTPGFDSAPYLTATLCVTRDPENGIQNMGTYRAALKATDRLGVRMVARVGGAGGYLHWLKYRDRKEPMPIAIVLGSAPVVFFTGPQKLAVDSDELAVAGGLAGAPIRKTKCVTHRSRGAGRRGNRHRRTDRHRGARARGAVRREQRLRRARSVQHADARHGDHAQALARVHGRSSAR